MKNRRNDYRHTFAPDDRLRVEVAAGPRHTVTGQIVDLSVGGMAVDLGDEAAALRDDEVCAARFSIPHGLRQFALATRVAHTRPNNAGAQLGLHFVPLDDPQAQDKREQALWVFLMDEQRRQIRQARGLTPPA